ncbi:uncharacterized protein EI90DRAFT_3122400 [Cantharellus anzutake]|uniref:uncharacterized protein n=1 Tax=Cantharellus anzutake TaxID=1750568 RepID=UPI001906C60F|nr:uncharacterized protein EI90DRAFT_3122400 [Cantharellus anzutake]KAF8332653.1 hypothetical protein EI90DRAFT_3122400 [Cantharellus anzutake]
MLVFELPTTGSVSFQDIIIDPSSAYGARLDGASSARASVRAILKESKRSGDRDFLKVLKVLDDYLPHLYAVIACIESGDLVLRNPAPAFSWRSTLSSNVFNNSPRHNFYGFQSELAFVLLTYAFSLSNTAANEVKSLGAYERERHSPADELEAKGKRLNLAVSLLTRSSGVFSHIADTVLVALSKESDRGKSNPSVADLNKSVIQALSKLVLADAQMLAVRKLLSKSAADAAFSPGPPLPSSHPKPSLLAKLLVEVSSWYQSATGMLNPGSGSKLSGRVGNGEAEVSADLRMYVKNESSFAKALVHKWSGVDRGESGKPGEAIAYLSWAIEELDEAKDHSRKIPTIAPQDKDRANRKERIADELAIVALFLDTYKQENNTIHFQKVPSRAELSQFMSGSAVVEPKPFTPTPLAPQTAGLPGDREDEKGKGIATNANYEGAGAYF